jgi:hypothetical protein
VTRLDDNEQRRRDETIEDFTGKTGSIRLEKLTSSEGKSAI